MKPHPQTISIVRELRNASDDEIQRCAISQAREMTERLRHEAPAACAAITHQVLTLLIYLSHLQSTHCLNQEGEHMLDALTEICDTAGLELRLTRISRATTAPEQDHL
ncbi:MAG: hypothetical protein IJO38_06050 [Akkermansia sp.]|nr:hypothetical protein [Akkermansia sp.]